MIVDVPSFWNFVGSVSIPGVLGYGIYLNRKLSKLRTDNADDKARRDILELSQKREAEAKLQADAAWALVREDLSAMTDLRVRVAQLEIGEQQCEIRINELGAQIERLKAQNEHLLTKKTFNPTASDL